MPVDKCGRSGRRNAATPSEIAVANVSNTFLKGDGTDTVASIIDVNGESSKNAADLATIKTLRPRIMWIKT